MQHLVWSTKPWMWMCPTPREMLWPSGRTGLLFLSTTADKGTQCAHNVANLSTRLCSGQKLSCCLFFFPLAKHLIPFYKASFLLTSADQLLLQDDMIETLSVSQSVVSWVLSYWIDFMEENKREQTHKLLTHRDPTTLLEWRPCPIKALLLSLLPYILN